MCLIELGVCFVMLMFGGWDIYCDNFIWLKDDLLLKFDGGFVFLFIGLE